MLISIIIGALNEENYIAETLRTARAQNTAHKFEVIVGDGYSEDKTVAIAKKYADKVVLEKNRSAAWQRQAASKVAKGEVLAVTDADVQIPSDWIQKIAEEFEKDPDLVMLYGPVYFSDTPKADRMFSKLMMNLLIGFTAIIGFHNPIGSNMALRRSAFEKVKGFNTSLVTCEDIDLARKMKKEGKVKYNSNFYVDVSARRVKKWGYLQYGLFHMLNALKFHLTGKSRADYAPVR